MGPSDDPLQVQVLTPWWEMWLPAGALLLSLASIALTLWFRYGDGTRIKAKWGWAYPMDPAGTVPEELVHIIVTNRSRSTATDITQVALIVPNNGAIIRNPDSALGSRFPARLEPGQSLSVFYATEDLGKVVAERQPKWMRIKVEHGHGTFLGRRDRNLPAKVTRSLQTSHP